MAFLPPKDGRFSITAIVGPNGSGKSNISDAIRWVMGEQSLKAIRGKKGEDIIFNGSETKGQMGMAEVSMILDNADGRVLKEYPEIVITRRLYRSGESEYLINGNAVRLFDIHLLLAQAQFAEGSYGIVGQGTIDKMLLLSPAERKDFLDEASGVKEFKIKRHQAQLKLNRTEENMSQAEVLIQEVEPRLKMLQRQVKKLEKRQILEVDLRDLQEKYYYTIYTRNKTELDETNAKLKIADESYDLLNQELLQVQTELSDLARSASRQEVFAELQKNHELAVREKNEVERNLAILDGQMHAEYGKEGKQNVNWLNGKLEELKLEKDKLDNESRQSLVLSEKNGLAILETKKIIDNYSAERAEKMIKISRLQSEMIEGRSEQNFFQYSGLATIRAVLEARDQLGKIYGTVAELGETDNEYRLALDVAAGGNLSSIVVESDDIARNSIEYLRTHKLGVATFLPRNKITSRGEEYEIDNLLNEDGVIGRAMDLIRFDEKFVNIFSYALGNTLVVKDLKTAQKIGIGRARMVTLDGDLVEKRGVMRGGWRKDRFGGLSFATKLNISNEDRVKECQKQLSIEQQALLDLERSIEEIKKELSNLELAQQSDITKSRLLQERMSIITKELAGVERELSFSQMSPEEFGEKLSQLAKEKEVLQTELTAKNQIIEKIETEIRSFNQAEEEKKQRVFSLQEIMQTKQGEVNAVSADRNDLRVLLARLETKAESLVEEVRNDMNATLDSIISRRDEVVEVSQLEDLVANIQKYKYQLNLIGGIDDEVISEYETTKERFDFLYNQLNDLKQAVKDLTAMIAELDDLMKAKRASAFRHIRKEFNRFFKILFEGGSADLTEVYEEDLPAEELLDANGNILADSGEMVDETVSKKKSKKDKVLVGVEISACPPGKKIKSLSALSGGERTLTSIALICAVLNHNPSPFVVLDEVEAALDEANTVRFTKIIEELTKFAQFIIITHNRVTMHAVDSLFGVAMASDGISRILSVKVDEAKE